jgi:hypothetical protein
MKLSSTPACGKAGKMVLHTGVRQASVVVSHAGVQLRGPSHTGLQGSRRGVAEGSPSCQDLPHLREVSIGSPAQRMWADGGADLPHGCVKVGVRGGPSTQVERAFYVVHGR